MNTQRQIALWWVIAPLVLGACVQIVGIEDPKPIGDTSSSSSGSSTTSSGGSSGNPGGPWVAWRMPNPASAGLPNPSHYGVDTTNDVVMDKVTGLMWQRSIAQTVYTWDEAKSYCQDLVLGPYDDWRLPSRIELVSIVDYTQWDPAIDTAFPNTPSVDFWSASVYADIPENAWTVEFYEGDSYPPPMSSAFSVRCVR